MATKKSGGNRTSGGRRWSARVTETSDALDVPGGTFAKNDPKAIARELERDAEKSTRKKSSSPYRSAMSMLTFYINRAGKNLPAARKKILEDAKNVLREEFGPQRGAAPSSGGRKKAGSGGRKTAGARKKSTASRKRSPAKRSRS